MKDGMNRRALLRNAGASIVAGTALTVPAAADDDDGPTVVSVEPKRKRFGSNDTETYTVEHVGDGFVEIDVHLTVSNSCIEVRVDDITETEDEDIVELTLFNGAATGELCLQAIFERRYVITLEYESEDAVNDVSVQVSEETGT